MSYRLTEGRFLIEEYPLTYAPSVSALRFLGAGNGECQGRLLALGNPDGSLPHAEDEVRSIAGSYGIRALTSSMATEDAIYDRVGDLDLLHLATHGHFDTWDPMFSYLELATRTRHDGRLEVHEIYDLDLQEVDLGAADARRRMDRFHPCFAVCGQPGRGEQPVAGR